jgi:hypothetical protein
VTHPFHLSSIIQKRVNLNSCRYRTLDIIRAAGARDPSIIWTIRQAVLYFAGERREEPRFLRSGVRIGNLHG